MRISDWSSDVCSSDLVRRTGQGHRPDAGDADRATDGARAPGHGASVLLGAVRRRRQLAPDGEGLNMRACRAFRIRIPGAQRWSLLALAVLSAPLAAQVPRSEEHTSELQSLMRSSYAVFCLKK